jgi:hypothetical protein
MATFKLTPDTGQVSGTHTNMPLVVIPSDITNFPSLTSAEAESIRFYSDASLSTELPREVVSADEIHVKVSSVSSSTEIWADYDGIRSDYGVTDPYGRNAAWSVFGHIYHMDDGKDSTGNSNAIMNGSLPTEVSAKIGDGQDFDGNGDYMQYTDDLATATEETILFWYKGTNTGLFMPFFKTGTGAKRIYINNGYVGEIQALYQKTGSSDRLSSATDSDTGINDGNFHRIGITVSNSSSDIKFYVDGVLVNSTMNSTNSFSGIDTATGYIGGEVQYSRRWADGIEDESFLA